MFRAIGRWLGARSTTGGSCRRVQGLRCGLVLCCATALSVTAYGIAAQAVVAHFSDTSTPLVGVSANRVMFWTKVNGLDSMTNPQLSGWQKDGVGGFVGETGYIWGLGGTQQLSARPGSGSNYSLESSIENSNIVNRAHALGMKLYLGFYLQNYNDTSTPIADWFDDAAWSNTVLPSVQAAAAAAHALGFDGIALDEELYPHTGGSTSATWDWDYPGNTHSESQTRQEAQLRGQQLMGAILSVFPNAEISVYGVNFPDTWWPHVLQVEDGQQDPYQNDLNVNFWSGMTSVEGYGGIWFNDESFYKTSSPAKTWATALNFEENSFYAMASQNFSDFSYAASRVFDTPSAWIDSDGSGSAYTAPRPASFVSQQLQAFSDWSPGGQFMVYAYAPLVNFDYGPYLPGIVSVSKPQVLPNDPPVLSVTKQQAGAEGVSLSGIANDSYAIRDVRWTSSSGASGAASDNWQVTGGSDSQGYSSQTVWSIPQIALGPGENQISVTAEDIHGLSTTTTIEVAGIGLPPATTTPDPAPQSGSLSGPSQTNTSTTPTTSTTSTTTTTTTTVPVSDSDPPTNTSTQQGSGSTSTPTGGATVGVALALATSIQAYAGAQQQVVVGHDFSSPVKALVKDSDGKPVSGITVGFNASGAGTFDDTGTAFTTAQTDSRGIAMSSTLKAGDTTGGYNVQAKISGLSTTARFSVTDLAGPVTSIKIVAGSFKSSVSGNAFGTPLEVETYDEYGNRTWTSPTFIAPTSGPSGTFANGKTTVTVSPSPSSGIVSAIFTAGRSKGSYKVWVFVHSVSAHFTLTNTS